MKPQSTAVLIDEEIICEWMERRPLDGMGQRVETANARWWDYSYQILPRSSGVGKEFHWQWHPCNLTLDRLWEVEERLTDEQRLAYLLELSKGGAPELGYWRIMHASANDKIAALSTILREAGA